MSHRPALYIYVALVSLSWLFQLSNAQADTPAAAGFDLQRMSGLPQGVAEILNSGSPQRCRSQLNQAVAGNGERAIADALCYLVTGDFAPAHEAAQEILKKRRSSAPALYISALALYHQGRLADSLTAANDALWFNRNSALRVDHVKAHVIRVLRELERHPLARESLQRAITEHPESLPLKREALHYAIIDGNRSAAISMARQILNGAPSDIETRVMLTEALIRGANFTFQRADIDEARSTAMRVLDSEAVIAPLKERAFLVALDAAIALQRVAEAQQTLKNFRGEFPNHPRIESYRKQLTISNERAQP